MLKQKKGFTLVELIITLAIASAIMISFIMLFQNASNLSFSSNQLATAQNFAKQKSDFIANTLRYANTAQLSKTTPNTLGITNNYLYLKNGKVYISYFGDPEEEIYNTSDYPKYRFDFKLTKTGSDLMQFELFVFYEGKEIYRTKSEIFMENLIGNSIMGEENGVCLIFTGTGITVEKITINSTSSIIVYKGQRLSFTATLRPRNSSTRGVAWSVSNEEIATIDQDGILTPIKNGVVDVIATAIDGSNVFAKRQIIIVNQ